MVGRSGEEKGQGTVVREEMQVLLRRKRSHQEVSSVKIDPPPALPIGPQALGTVTPELKRGPKRSAQQLTRRGGKRHERTHKYIGK